MKKAFASLLLLASIPFSLSCIANITYDVTIVPRDPENCHCSWDPPKKATRNRPYEIRFYLEEGYELWEDQDSIFIEIGSHSPISKAEWTYSDGLLTISAGAVTHDIKITVTDDIIQ